jgi:hypothetical protein
MVPPPTGTAEVAARAAAEPDEVDGVADPVSEVEDAADDELGPSPAALVEGGGVAVEPLLLFEDEQPAQTAPAATAIPRRARRRVPSGCARQDGSS